MLFCYPVHYVAVLDHKITWVYHNIHPLPTKCTQSEYLVSNIQ